MSTYYNAVPKVVFNGIRDRSRRAFIRPEITFAQHTPLLRLFTETGPTETTYVGDSEDGFASIFGQSSLDPRSKYFNQQSLLALNLLGQGNGFYVKRLKPEDAGNPARITVALEMVQDMIPASVTRLSGFNYPDAVTDTGNGPIASGTDTVEGYRARIVLIADNQSEVGTQRRLPGTMVSGMDGSQSTVYPLFELPASFFGQPGNNLGMRIWAPTQLDPDGYDEFTGQRFKTRLYRVQFVELMDGTSTPIIIKTKTDEDYVNVSFDEGVWSEQYDRDLTIDEVLIDQYNDDGIESGMSPLYSPFSQCYVYRDNVELVREIIYDAETRVNPAINAHIDAPGQIDFLTMLGEDGDPYQSIKLEGPIEGGVLLGKNATVYAQGGKDGTTTLDEYVKLVDIENTNFGKLGDQYENVALYQFGILYDTGLPMASKYKAMQVLSARRDVQYFFTTFVEGETRLPTASEEVSRVQALMTRLKAFPEATLYGTPVCRAMIVMQSGKLVGGGYNKFVPQLLDVAMMWSRYAGAGTGILRAGAEMDVDPNNRVTMVKKLNVPFFNARTSANLWANGATYSTSYDHRSNYYPCLRSVYLDDTSVLLSPITVNICCVIMRLIHKIHAKFSGNAFLTKEQLVERCDQEILDRTRDLFGGRVDVIPRTEITGIDENNGTSWTCTVTVAANNPRTTLNFQLETVRRENVTEQQ
ncbi:tail sheath protein [Pseudomonas phage PA1C]|uniref:Tail sheath protein gp29 gp29PR domain-containing protein n=3 Tax=root TaxID=1 RepID=A0A5C1K7K2_9CAUD|nr:tail sheath [Pseudomonas phage vB_PaeM_PS119XW]QBX32158.1 tail sheath protein [Pseudomonas phage PA1C]QEM41739.1 hypothetical protein [Pseudomonas phage vB_PaeM_PS119XW]BEG72650.1 hypothetical protein RVBP21_2780 [Pseudomonas phage BRkr]